jgi:hypothetical protein
VVGTLAIKDRNLALDAPDGGVHQLPAPRARSQQFLRARAELTIYNKLITDFTPNTPKYVFKGIAEFATDTPEIITGDTYEAKAGTLFDELIRCKINIFNISKINSEVRGGKSPRIKRLSEYIGESYFDYLAGLAITFDGL